MKPPDAIVVGAGIVGAFCAYELRRAGLRVIVLDEHGAGQGATAAGMGHIVVMDDSEPQFELCRYSQRLWAELRPRLPSAVEWHDCGTLWVADGDEELAEAQRKRAHLTDQEVRAEFLDDRALAEAEPNLRPGLAGGLVQPDDSVIYAPVAATWLLRESCAELRSGVRVSEVRSGSIHLPDGGELSAGVVVIAAGERTPSLLPGIPVRPRKGHLAITDRFPGFLHHQVVELGYVRSAAGESAESVAFNVQPRPTGQLLIGSSRQYGVETPEVDAPLLARMLRRCVEYVPKLADLSVIRIWTGFRASTPDKLPVIGPHPQLKRVWLATGHEGLGITMAPGTARILADQVLGRTPEISTEPFLPARFSEVGHHA